MKADTQTQHTPGPWFLRDGGAACVQVEHEAGDMRSIVAICRESFLCDETGDFMANARLIAAAPELYQIVRALVDGGGIMSPSRLFTRAKAVISRVEGKA